MWLQGLICGAVVATEPGSALLVLTLLIPALAYHAMTLPGRRGARAMLLMGAASTFMPLRTLWCHDASLATAVNLLGDPNRLLVSWVSVAAGWFVAELAEVATKLTLDGRARQSVHALKRERDDLAREWEAAAPVAE